ncbi:ROK family protein [Robertmurraya andreesenii]|uniref:NBD/HSP70 family sugar kinase n=1 Tax=Anoxybacillus andreesenii TaxID=1325932 RepID=A0ABT9V0Z1_9BACL|nr:ROK family protein [Robertmurraya andreesenii]MDQ0154618.1 putative NBD/HSP70 family sugar kinase [Robertmurraya andreesenii]
MNNYAVFDTGGSSIKYAVMEETGQVIEKFSIPTPKDGISSFVHTIETIVKDFQTRYVISGIALSMPGAVDVESGYIKGVTAIPYLHGPNIRKLLEEKLNLPVELENDANCAGLAEGWLGAAKDVNDYICIVIGTGIGGSLFLDKKIRHGANLFAGEFGYMILEDFHNQPIGETWSSLAATGGLIKQVAKRKNMDPEILDGKKVFAMAEQDDKEVQEEIEKFIKRLAVGIYNLQYIIDPEKILIGGAISNREGLIENINEKLKQMRADQHCLEIQVEKCQFGNDSNLIGALYHFLQRNSSRK